MTLNPVCENVETAQGVPLTVTGVAQVKIMKNADLLQTASEQFLGKKEHEIKSTVLQTLEGHLRAILGKFVIFSRESSKKTYYQAHLSHVLILQKSKSSQLLPSTTNTLKSPKMNVANFLLKSSGQH